VKTRILILAVLFGYSLIGSSVSTYAQDQSGDDSAARCRISQSFITTTIRPRDLRARVNRLQAYRYIYSRLDTFVQRLEHNDQSYATELRADLNQLSDKIERFKEDYEVYDQARQNVINQNECSKNFTTFQEKLEIARVNRQQVGTDVAEIQSILETIKGRVVQLRQELLATGQSEAASE
jgi:TolA-binding protein